MPPRAETKRARLESYLAAKRPECIDEPVWGELQSLLAPVSASYLRHLLKATGISLAPIVEGVRQDTLEDAARTLTALSRLYAVSDAQGHKQVRAVVIESKDRIRWALKRPASGDPEDAARRAMKKEILLWTVTWLENPAVFEPWLALRRSLAQ